MQFILKKIRTLKFKQIVGSLLTAAVLLGAQINIRAQNDNTADFDASQEDVVLQWNRVLMETVSTPGQHPATIMPVRSYAMMHAAMFDAVNSIDGSYEAYLTDVPGSKNASVEAAAAQAAHDVLAALYPTRLAVFDAELTASLEGIRPYRLQQGISVGQRVAERLLAERANDGWNANSAVVCSAADSGQLAADTARQFRRDLYALSGGRAVCHDFEQSIFARSAARFDERGIYRFV